MMKLIQNVAIAMALLILVGCATEPATPPAPTESDSARAAQGKGEDSKFQNALTE